MVYDRIFFSRLSAALACGSALDLINAACSEQGLLALYRAELPQQSQQSGDVQISAIDGTSKQIMEVYQPVMLEQYAPLSVLGDGNCLYRAVSRSICGNESLHVLIRLKTAIEIITNRKFYDTGRRSYEDLINDNRIVITEYKKLVEDTLKLGSYSEMIHIYAISAVLKVPVRSYYPPQLQPELASDAYTRKVIGRNVKSACSSDIVIMWTQMCFPRNIKRFTPNHFVTLRDIRSEPVETVIVSDDELHACSEPKKKKINLKLKKKTESISSNVSAHSEYVQTDAQTGRQPDIVSDVDSGTLSSNKEIGCSVEDSLSDHSVCFADNHVDVSNVPLHKTDQTMTDKNRDTNQTTEQTKRTKKTKLTKKTKPTKKTKQTTNKQRDTNQTAEPTKQTTTKTKLTNDKDCNKDIITEHTVLSDVSDNGWREHDSREFSELDQTRQTNNDTNQTAEQTKQTTTTNQPSDKNCDKDSPINHTLLSEVSDNGWREPDSRDFSELDQSRQTNDNNNESFDQQNLDDSLAFANQTDSDITQNSTELNSDCGQWGALNGTFMEINALVSLLQKSEHCLDKIPLGLKENVYYVVRNDNNMDRRKNGQKSKFSDDCGVWQGSSGGTPTTYFLILPSGELKGIVKRVNEGYCFKQKKKGQYYYVPLNPQPLDTEVIELHRYYAKLKKNATYQKRVSWLGLGGDSEIAVVEYIGAYPGLGPHGNSKHKDEYMRTPDNVMDEMREMLKSKKPKQVYDKLSNKHDELSGPSNLQQVQDMKRKEALKERINSGLTSNRQNIADHLIEIENRVSRNDPFIRSVIRQNGKAPCIILYNDEQIHDLKLLCCTGQTVLGVDKTFNLCDMHVTVTCYKQLSVVKEGTTEPPLFIGPIFIHDNSDFDTYCNFFFNLKIKLNDVDTSKLVIGSDDERALVNAIKAAFPQSQHILCTRHLRQNASQKLTDDAVDKYEKATILDKIFGDDGLLHADDSICFEEKCEDLESISQSVSRNFTKYFQKRLKTLLRQKRHDPDVATQTCTGKMWTNNNCESVNHVLKQAIDWKKQPLLDFINQLHELVEGQVKNLKKALVDYGRFRLAASHKHFLVSKTVWANKTSDEKLRLFRRFRKHEVKNERLVKSTDGQSEVVAPRTKGQKIGQRKRPRTERTTTVPAKKRKN